MPKAHTQLLEGALVSGVHNFDCGRPGGAYTALVRNPKMEILAGIEGQLRPSGFSREARMGPCGAHESTVHCRPDS